MQKQLNIRNAVIAAALAACGSSAWAQQFTIVAQEGQPAGSTGVGNVTFVDFVQTNNAGTTLIEADTNNLDTNADQVIMRDLALFQREGQALPAPAGATLDFWGTMSLNDAGDVAQNITIDGTTGINDDTAVYLNQNLLIQEGVTPTGLPGAPAGEIWRGFFGVKVNDATPRQLLVAGTSGTVTPSLINDTIALYTLDGAGTGIASAVTVARETTTLPGLNGNIQALELTSNEWAFNDAGRVIFSGDTDNATTTADAFIYLTGPNGTGGAVIAQEGSPSPVAGRNYGTLVSPEVDLNNNGDYVFVANLAGGTTTTNDAIIRNGAVFVQEGDAVPGVPGLVFDNLASAQVALDDAGNLAWVGEFNSAATTDDRGLFYNDTLLLREGVSTVEGQLVETINMFEDTLSFSDNGQFLFVDVVLAGGLDTAVMIAIPEPGMLGLFGAGAAALVLRRRGRRAV